jgi:hypothetical protein
MTEEQKKQEKKEVDRQQEQIKLYLKRVSVSEPQEREDGTEFVNVAINARGLSHNCPRITFIADADDVESFVDDLKSINKRSIALETEVVYVERTYDEDTDQPRTVIHANGRLHDVGMALDDALDAIEETA